MLVFHSEKGRADVSGAVVEPLLHVSRRLLGEQAHAFRGLARLASRHLGHPKAKALEVFWGVNNFFFFRKFSAWLRMMSFLKLKSTLAASPSPAEKPFPLDSCDGIGRNRTQIFCFCLYFSCLPLCSSNQQGVRPLWKPCDLSWSSIVGLTMHRTQHLIDHRRVCAFVLVVRQIALGLLAVFNNPRNRLFSISLQP